MLQVTCKSEEVLPQRATLSSAGRGAPTSDLFCYCICCIIFLKISCSVGLSFIFFFYNLHVMCFFVLCSSFYDYFKFCIFRKQSTILDKTVEKIAFLGGIFSKLRSRPILPSPLPPDESSVVGSSKESRISKHLQEATLNWGRGFSLRKAVDLEIVLLRQVRSAQ